MAVDSEIASEQAPSGPNGPRLEGGASGRGHLPKAEEKMVFDKFHIAKHLGEAVDRVRRREHKVLKAEGDERLKGTKYDWLRNPASMEGEQKREFAELSV